MSRHSSQDSQNEGKPKEVVLKEKASVYEGIVIDEATNKRVVRKIDWRLMPIVSLRPLPSGLPFRARWTIS